MSYFFKQLKRYAEVLLITLLLVAALFSLLTYVGNFPNDFMPVIGHLFLMLFEIGLLAIVPTLILLRKKDLAKLVFTIYASFWLIASIYSTLGDSGLMRGGVHGLWISISVFEFLIAGALLNALAFFIIGKKQNDVKKFNLTALILLGAYGAFFIVFVLNIAAFAVFRWGWTSYIGNFKENLFLPAAMFLGLFYFGFMTVNFPEKPIVIPEESEEADKKEEGDASNADEEEAPAEVKAEEEEEDAFSALKPFDDSASETEEAAEVSDAPAEAEEVAEAEESSENKD